MTPKLIISSIVGVAAIGGGVTGFYYAFSSSNTKESENKVTNQTKTEEISSKTAETSSKPTTQVQSSEPNSRVSTVVPTAPNTLKPSSHAVAPGNNDQP